ncbi:MAG: 3-hydroxyacyl-CoA dehydrogenase NAD-binding domain-containing protein, partial [Robiginitalea sp.]
MKHIAVIGAGTMGNGIAHVFAQNDYEVHLVDISEDSLQMGMATIEKNLQRMVRKEVIDAARVGQILGNITTSTNLSESVADADLVVEAATEDT